MSETTFPPGTVLTVSPSPGERSVVKSAASDSPAALSVPLLETWSAVLALNMPLIARIF